MRKVSSLRNLHHWSCTACEDVTPIIYASTSPQNELKQGIATPKQLPQAIGWLWHKKDVSCLLSKSVVHALRHMRCMGKDNGCMDWVMSGRTTIMPEAFHARWRLLALQDQQAAGPAKRVDDTLAQEFMCRRQAMDTAGTCPAISRAEPSVMLHITSAPPCQRGQDRLAGAPVT